MPTVAELAGTDKEKQGPGFKSLAEDEKPEPPKISSHLFVGFRLLLIWLLHLVDFSTDIWVAVILQEEGRSVLFTVSVVFLVIPTLLRWMLASFSMNPCTPDFLGLRDENPPLYPQLAYVPIFGELVLIVNAMAWHRKYGDRTELNMAQEASDVTGALMFLRLLEGAFEAMPQTIVQGIVLYEDLTSSHVRFIQWQSFIVSFVALGTSFASVAMHRQRDKWKEETKHNKKKKKVETSWEVIKGFCLMLFLGVDSFLRMNSIASVLYSPYAIWFPLYIAVAYAGLPLLVVTGTMIFVNCCDKEQQGQVSCCGHLAILGIMYCGTLLMSSLAFLIPLDLVMCWSYPPFSILRLFEHLAMAVLSFWVAAPLTWVPLALWFVSAVVMIPARMMLELPCGEEVFGKFIPKIRWRRNLPRVHPEDSQQAEEAEIATSSWKTKVRELSYRGFTIARLLDFCEVLGSAQVMPHFDATKTTTNDVVRQVIIPWSRLDGGWEDLKTGHGQLRSEGRAMVGCMEATRQQPSIMVTHNWDNLFSHLAASTLASALNFFTFDNVLKMLATPTGIQELRRYCYSSGCLRSTVWICSFSINQHASICAGFGAPPEDPEAFAKFDAKRRDSVTKKIYRTCTCETTKYFNDARDLCELNKFDAMMHDLSQSSAKFRQAVAVDVSLQLFSRAWCVAELVEARRLGLQQQLVVYSRNSVSGEKTLALKKIRVQNCQASRPEDVEEILAKIDDKDKFNKELQGALFDDSDSLFKKLFESQLNRTDLHSALLDALA